jgi:hypothetical protein
MACIIRVCYFPLLIACIVEIFPGFGPTVTQYFRCVPFTRDPINFLFAKNGLLLQYQEKYVTQANFYSNNDKNTRLIRFNLTRLDPPNSAISTKFPKNSKVSHEAFFRSDVYELVLFLLN